MSSSKKNLPVKGLCCRCLLEFIGRWHSQSWYFRPSFGNYRPSNILSGSSPPFPLLPLQSTLNTERVWLGGGAGCWVLLETKFCRSLTLYIWPEYKLLDHRKQKPAKSLFQVHFFRWRHLALLSISLIFLQSWHTSIRFLLKLSKEYALFYAFLWTDRHYYLLLAEVGVAPMSSARRYSAT